MVKNSLLGLCLSVLCVPHVSAMLCVVKRISLPIAREQKRVTSTYMSDAYRNIKKIVGLTKCRQAYETTGKCRNSLCCSNIFTGCKNIEIQREYSRKRACILEKIDREGRLKFLLRMQKAYNGLNFVSQHQSLYGNTSNKTNEWLMYLILHHKHCLRNQLRVIQEDSPHIAFIDENDQFVVSLKDERLKE